MMLNRGASLFRRYEGNPILTPRNWPYPANSVFNPGAAQVDGEALLLVRVEDMRGFSHLTVARSWDGRTNWVVDPEPTLEPEPNIREEQWGLEDPRIVFLEDEGKYAVTYVSFSQGGPLISLALTEDFRRFERRGPLLPPEDKDASLFPKRALSKYRATASSASSTRLLTSASGRPRLRGPKASSSRVVAQKI